MKQNTLITVAVIVAVGYGLYYLYNKNKKAEKTASTPPATSTPKV